jgi:hypothetical protein
MELDRHPAINRSRHSTMHLKRICRHEDISHIARRRGGRAARNVDGKVILYADQITGSMERAIAETDRRSSTINSPISASGRGMLTRMVAPPG